MLSPHSLKQNWQFKSINKMIDEAPRAPSALEKERGEREPPVQCCGTLEWSSLLCDVHTRLPRRNLSGGSFFPKCISSGDLQVFGSPGGCSNGVRILILYRALVSLWASAASCRCGRRRWRAPGTLCAHGEAVGPTQVAMRLQ